MLDLPARISEWLLLLVKSQRAVAHLLVDGEQILINAGGDLEHYGLAGLQHQRPACDQLPFLEGLLPLPETPFLLRSMGMPSGRVADVHFFADEDATWVVLLDVTAEHDEAQEDAAEGLRHDAAEPARGSPHREARSRPQGAHAGPSRADHRVRIRIVLQKDAHAVLEGQQLAHLLDADPEHGAVHLWPKDVAHRAAEHHGAHVRVMRERRRPRALVDDQDGDVGRHLRTVSRTRPGSAAPGTPFWRMSITRSLGENRAPAGPGSSSGPASALTSWRARPMRVFPSLTRKTQLSELPGAPWKRRKRKSVGQTTTRRMGGPKSTPLARADRSGAVLGQAQGVGQDERHEVVGR